MSPYASDISRAIRRTAARISSSVNRGSSWLGFDQLDFMGAYALVAIVHAPPLGPTLLALPIVFVGSVATTVIGYAIGWKEAWI